MCEKSLTASFLREIGARELTSGVIEPEETSTSVLARDRGRFVWSLDGDGVLENLVQRLLLLGRRGASTVTLIADRGDLRRNDSVLWTLRSALNKEKGLKRL